MTVEKRISFFVGGTPVPQGNMRAFLVKGKPIVTSTTKDLKAWRQRIAGEAQRAAEAAGGFYEEGDFAYIVEARFQFSRPKSYAKSYFYRNNKRPDLDKLIRTLLDGITGILIEDDAQVNEVKATKDYIDHPSIPGISPGVYVSVLRTEGRFKR